MGQNSFLDFEIEKHQFKNGLYPASVGSENRIMRNYGWVRDTRFIFDAVSEDSRNKIISAFQTIVDKIKEKGKFDYSNTDWSQDWVHIHPLYDENLEEKTEVGWGYVQNDSVGNVLEIFSEARDEGRARLIVDYLDEVEYWVCPDYGFWEEGPKQVRSSSLAACIRGLESYQRNFKMDSKVRRKTDSMIDSGYMALCKILPWETEGRKSDMALLSLLYPGRLDEGVITSKMKQYILKNIMPLLADNDTGRIFGVKRYIGDKWDGKSNSLIGGNEMQWTMGLPWLYLATGNEKYLERARELKKEFGTLPEGFIGGKPNCTPCLLWAEAIYRLAEKKFNS